MVSEEPDATNIGELKFDIRYLKLVHRLRHELRFNKGLKNQLKRTGNDASLF